MHPKAVATERLAVVAHEQNHGTFEQLSVLQLEHQAPELRVQRGGHRAVAEGQLLGIVRHTKALHRRFDVGCGELSPVVQIEIEQPHQEGLTLAARLVDERQRAIDDTSRGGLVGAVAPHLLRLRVICDRHRAVESKLGSELGQKVLRRFRDEQRGLVAGSASQAQHVVLGRRQHVVIATRQGR
jgi:hypothetical protein